MPSEPLVCTLVTGQKPPQDTQKLADEITRLAGHINAANYRFLSLVAEFDRLGGWSGAGIKSCAHWLQWKCGITSGAAREKVRVARSLEQLPKISTALANGELSYSMVRAISRKADASTEDYYLYIARHGTVSHVEQLVRKHDYAERLQSSGREEIQYESRTASCYRDDDGCWVVKARLAPAEGELFFKALNAIADQEEEDSDDSKPLCDFGQKRADALSTMAEHYLASAEDGISALKGGERCQVMLHVDVNTLQEHSDHCNCRLDQDNWLHPDTAKRLACDASLVTVLEDDKGKVLNIGRRSRIVPPHISRALATRDHNQCRFPGCSCTRYTDAHHIRHWADGGETSLDNLLTLCRFHHRALHQGELTIARGDDLDDFIFSNMFGNEITPTVRPQFPDQDAANGEILRIEEFCKDVSAETCITGWRGESMDYDIAVQALLRREELAPGPGDSP
jgi:hypothetical protein